MTENNPVPRPAPRMELVPAELVAKLDERLASIDRRLAAVEKYVTTAEPLIGELAEAMPQLRQLALIGEQMAQGGLGGLMAAFRGGQ